MAPVDAEHLQHLAELLAIEERDERAQHAAALAELDAAALRARGLALDGLEAMDEHWGLGGRLILTFETRPHDIVPDTFDSGAVVEVWLSQDAEPRPRGVVVRSSRRRLEVAFDHLPPPEVTSGRISLRLAPSDVTYRRAAAALAATAAAARPHERRTQRRFLGAEPPRFLQPPANPPPPEPRLNVEQAAAVSRALCAEDYFLVHGPPGTGKSTVLRAIAAALLKRGETLLLTAASNAAVDNLLGLCADLDPHAIRLGHPARIHPELYDLSLDARLAAHSDRQVARSLFDEAALLRGYAGRQRRQGRSRDRLSHAHSAQVEARKLVDEARQLERRAVDDLLGRARLIACTAVHAGTSMLARREVDTVLFDEATQATQPLALVPLLRARRWIFAGDHQQLPPTVLSVEAARRGLDVSVFAHLIDIGGAGASVRLAEQHRMHAALMAFPSAELYDDTLRAHPSAAQRDLAALYPECDAATELGASPLLVVDTAGRGLSEERDPTSESIANPGEALLIVARLRALLAAGVPPGAIGVIAPYSAQVAALRRALDIDGLEIDSVDAFQGREKDVILLSLVRANDRGEVGFLADVRRMNVAMTRARGHLFVVGDSGTLATHPFYERFFAHAQKSGAYRSVWEWPDAEVLP